MMDAVWDVVVVGAGPAGLMAALASAEAGARTLLLEKKAGPGHKLLVSGSGRCNLTHAGPLADFLGHYGGAGRFLKPSLFGFTNEATVAFFESRGVPCVTEGGGKVFPASGRAGDLLKVLVAEAVAKGVELRAGTRVLGLAREGGGFVLTCQASPGDPERIEASRVILAMGGSSWPVTGSEGEGCKLAASLGHPIADLGPALTPLVTTGFPVADLAGLSLEDRALSLWRAGAKVAQGRGDILFTHRGLSGPGILDFSRHVRPGDEVGIGLSGLGEAAASDLLLAGAKDHGKRLVRSLLGDLGLPGRLMEALVAHCVGDPEARASTLTKEGRRRLAAALGELKIAVAALGGWDEAMATRGGVALEAVDPKTLESRIAPGLYFAGEVLDVDGDSGGYNIQAAFSTGRLAGRMAAAGKSLGRQG